MQRMWSWISRHRLAFLVGVLITAIVLAVVPGVSGGDSILLPILGVAIAIAVLVASGVRRPAAFLIDDGAFATPRNAAPVLSAGLLTVLCAESCVWAVDQHDNGPGSDWPLNAVAVFLLLLLPVQWYGALGRFGLFLRPDGLLDRQPLGTLFVPWEAGPTSRLAGTSIKLRLAHPDLAVRRGFNPGTSIATGADPAFTARAITLYATRPEYRPSIGTTAGLSLLDDH